MDYDRLFCFSMIQFIDVKINMLKMEKDRCEKIVLFANKILKFQIFVPFIIAFIAFLFEGLTNISNFINSSLYGLGCGLVGSVFPVLIATIYCVIVKKTYNKNIMEICNEIDVSLDVKKKMNEELVKLNDKSDDLCDEKNNVFMLEYQMNNENNINEDIREMDKTKKFVLKRKK